MDGTVLCVDADERVGAVADAVDDGSFGPRTATTVADAKLALADEDVVCVVTAHDLADGSGMDVLEAVRAERPQTPVVLFTDRSPGDVDTSGVEEHVVEYLDRSLPDARDRLAFVVEDVVAHHAQVGFLEPADEGERLAALERYDVDALPVVESFERLTDLVAGHFDVAVAFVGLVGRDEEEFVACAGADWDSLTRENSVCTHSMLQDDVMVVEDLRADARFRENDRLLQDLGVRSYAGANMTTPDGHVIGQLCVLDDEPRTYDAAQRETLQQYAETAMEILELRRSLRDAQRAVSQE